MYEQTCAETEIYGAGENLLVQGSVMKLPQAIRDLYGKAQCVYADPPFMTGQKFTRKRPYGEKGWRRGVPALTLPAYEDRFPDEKSYLRMIRRVIGTGRELLKDTGVFCLHLDWRMAAPVRLLCDRVFGKTRFVNEIIWAYESGGRSRRFFPRKHEVILVYAKSERYRFDLTRVPLPRGEKRRNHMARGVDENGNHYSSIVSNGKEYRYYDDEPVYPGDVWADIGFLQQRDPERTGYATQKPVRLLERLLLPVTEPGDLVVDLCCGSGTTLAAAEKLGCRWAGLDLSPEAIAVTLNRLTPENVTVICPTSREKAELNAEYDARAGRLRVRGLGIPGGPLRESGSGLDDLESWETGTLENGVFRVRNRFSRSWKYPELVDSLAASPEEVSVLMTTDAAGVRRIYRQKEQ